MALNVQQVVVRPWRADQFASDTAAIRQREQFEQEASLPRNEVTDPFFQIKHRFFGKVCGTDLPGSTVVPRFEAQAMEHGLGFFQGVQVADVMPLVEHFSHHGVDHLAHQPGGLTAFIQLNRNGLAFADQGEIVIEQTGEQLQLIVGQMGLLVVYGSKAGRAVVFVGDLQQPFDMKVVVAASKWV